MDETKMKSVYKDNTPATYEFSHSLDDRMSVMTLQIETSRTRPVEMAVCDRVEASETET